MYICVTHFGQVKNTIPVIDINLVIRVYYGQCFLLSIDVSFGSLWHSRSWLWLPIFQIFQVLVTCWNVGAIFNILLSWPSYKDIHISFWQRKHVDGSLWELSGPFTFNASVTKISYSGLLGATQDFTFKAVSAILWLERRLHRGAQIFFSVLYQFQYNQTHLKIIGSLIVFFRVDNIISNSMTSGHTVLHHYSRIFFSSLLGKPKYLHLLVSILTRYKCSWHIWLHNSDVTRAPWPLKYIQHDV